MTVNEDDVLLMVNRDDVLLMVSRDDVVNRQQDIIIVSCSQYISSCESSTINHLR
jgi:hypothetical protein